MLLTEYAGALFGLVLVVDLLPERSFDARERVASPYALRMSDLMPVDVADGTKLRLACLLLAIGCLPELAFDARELTLQAHMSTHMSTLVSGDLTDKLAISSVTCWSSPDCRSYLNVRGRILPGLQRLTACESV
jgi:hypothetical protein